jgi:hypothetical protein
MVTLRSASASITAVVAASGFAACSSGQIVTITGPDDAATLALLVFRDGVDGSWQSPRTVGDGRYEISVHGPYTVEYVCVPHGPVSIVELARTPDDPPEISASCAFGHVEPTGFEVHGTMTPAGIVQLGNGSAGARSDGAYALFVSGGTYDLVAQTMTAPRRLAIRRGITVAGTTTIAPIDVDREGVAMIDLPITVTGVPAGWQFTSGVDVATPSTEAVLFGIDPGATTLPIVPDGALQPTDHQNIFVALDTAGGVRLISRRVVPGGSTVFAVPPEYPVRYDIPTAQTTGRLTVHWETLAPYEQVHLLANQVPAGGTPGNIAHLLDVSASYLAITGDNHATFDTDIPGFDPSWRFDFQSSWHIAGSVTSTGANGADVVRADDLAIVSAPGATP